MDVHLSPQVLLTLRMHDFDNRRQQRRSDTPLRHRPYLLPGAQSQICSPGMSPQPCSHFLADLDCHNKGVSVAVQAEHITPFEDMPTLQVKQTHSCKPALRVSSRTHLFVLPLPTSTPHLFRLFSATPASKTAILIAAAIVAIIASVAGLTDNTQYVARQQSSIS